MAIIVNGERRFELPGSGIVFRWENPCHDDWTHSYSDIICPVCGRDFCHACSDHGNCPSCGHDPELVEVLRKEWKQPCAAEWVESDWVVIAQVHTGEVCWFVKRGDSYRIGRMEGKKTEWMVA